MKDDEGLYYNIRLDVEVIRRLKYSESRRNNRKTNEKDNNICSSYVKHMETITETISSSPSLEERKTKFIETVGSLNHGFTNGQLTEFTEYWTAINPGDKKMAFEKQKQFFFSQRIATWKRNDKQNGTDKIRSTPYISPSESASETIDRLRRAKGIIK